jgi:hypothetical protein
VEVQVDGWNVEPVTITQVTGLSASSSSASH